MEQEIIELKQKIELLTKENADLKEFKQEYASSKQSFNRMGVRLRKLCKRLTPTNEILIEMKQISDDIRDLVNKITL